MHQCFRIGNCVSIYISQNAVCLTSSLTTLSLNSYLYIHLQWQCNWFMQIIVPIQWQHCATTDNISKWHALAIEVELILHTDNFIAYPDKVSWTTSSQVLQELLCFHDLLTSRCMIARMSLGNILHLLNHQETCAYHQWHCDTYCRFLFVQQIFSFVGIHLWFSANLQHSGHEMGNNGGHKPQDVPISNGNMSCTLASSFDCGPLSEPGWVNLDTYLGGLHAPH